MKQTYKGDTLQILDWTADAAYTEYFPMLAEGSKLLLDVTWAPLTWKWNLPVPPKTLLSEEALTENTRC